MFSLEEFCPDEQVLRLSRCIQLDDLGRYDPLVEHLLGGGHPLVTVDLSGLRTINILTIEKLLLLEQELWKRGRSLRIRGCRSGVYAAFQYLKLERFLHFV